MIKNLTFENIKKLSRHPLGSVFLVSTLLFTGCTSLGHEGRMQPQIDRKLPTRPDVVSVSGTGELATAIELMLVSKGISVKASPIQAISQTQQNNRPFETVVRYAVNATSVDHDFCMPEGSRQMHFNISVVDLVENQRVFAMNGDYGCKDTIVNRFERWFFR